MELFIFKTGIQTTLRGKPLSTRATTTDVVHDVLRWQKCLVLICTYKKEKFIVEICFFVSLYVYIKIKD